VEKRRGLKELATNGSIDNDSTQLYLLPRCMNPRASGYGWNVSDELRKYIDGLRYQPPRAGREWYWKKNAHRPKALAYALEYEPFTLTLKTWRFFAVNVRRYLMLWPLTVSNRPSGVLWKPSDFKLERESRRPNSLRIQTSGSHGLAPSAEKWTAIEKAPPLTTGNRKLVILHAFYEDEATAIFQKLDGLTDYDLMLTTPVPAIRDQFLSRFDPARSICFLVPNAGRDVLPFLLLLAFADLSPYSHFVKMHTKRSPHLTEGSSWFSSNMEILIGNKQMTDAMFQLIDPARTEIYGVESRTLRDHFRNNRHWLESLLQKKGRDCQGTFIPGTMFAGSAEFLRRLAGLNLHLHQFEQEKGQLDGCLVHALERYFGYVAQLSGGECGSFDELIAEHR
jgi:hypothetical protein